MRDIAHPRLQDYGTLKGQKRDPLDSEESAARLKTAKALRRLGNSLDGQTLIKELIRRVQSNQNKMLQVDPQHMTAIATLQGRAAAFQEILSWIQADEEKDDGEAG